MKKLIVLLLAISCGFSLLTVPAAVAFAAGDSTVIVFDGEKQGDEVLIRVNVRENSGIYSMLLTLEYDRAVLELTNLRFGNALSSLEPMASGDYSVDPYKISYLGTGEANDTSTGRMLTLTFAVREGAPDGDYAVTFGYEKNKDVILLKGGRQQTKNLVIEGAKVTLSGGDVESITILEADTDTQEDTGYEEPKNNSSLGWIIGGSVGGALLLSGAAVLVVWLVKKRKGKWIKV